MDKDIATIISSGSSHISFYMDEEHILHITTVGGINEDIAFKAKDLIIDVLKNRSYCVNILADLNKIGQDSPQANKIWKELGALNNTGKIAFTGLHLVAQLFATFLMARHRKKHMKFFRDKNDALNWLRSKV